MYCSSCGTQIPDGSKFCTNCGATLQGVTPVSDYAPSSTEPAAPVTTNGTFTPIHQTINDDAFGNNGSTHFQAIHQEFSAPEVSPETVAKANKALIFSIGAMFLAFTVYLSFVGIVLGVIGFASAMQATHEGYVGGKVGAAKGLGIASVITGALMTMGLLFSFGR